MAFDPITSPVDYLVISGQRTPGVAEVTGASSPRQWDERRGIDMLGATLRYRGAKLGRFSVKLRLTTAEDFAAWTAFSPVVLARPQGGRGALDVQYPLLNDLGIISAVVEDVVAPTPDGDSGAYIVEIKMIERRAPAPVGSTAAGSVNTPAPNPLQAEIAENNRQIEMRNAAVARYR